MENLATVYRILRESLPIETTWCRHHYYYWVSFETSHKIERFGMPITVVSITLSLSTSTETGMSPKSAHYAK